MHYVCYAYRIFSRDRPYHISREINKSVTDDDDDDVRVKRSHNAHSHIIIIRIHKYIYIELM